MNETKPTSIRGSSRERILEAARALFHRQGFEATSFSDIAREAGIPRGNFYYHFKTKDEILRAVIARWRTRLEEALGQIERATPQPLERIHRMLAYPLEESETNVRYGCPLGSLVYELRKAEHPPQVWQEAVGLFDVLADWLAARLRELGWSAGPARLLALRALARLQGAILLASAYGDQGLLAAEVADLYDWIRHQRPQENAP